MSFISTPTPLPVSQGGTGESNPSLIAGAGIVIAGPWPDQTISATASTYIEVANYAALPAPATVPGAIYVVLASTGIYFINRRSAGFYQSDGIAWTYLAEIGENYFNDANLEFFDDADPSKIVKFQLGGLTTGTTRTYATPNASGTLALTSDIPSPIVSTVTASAPLASSGGANPNITITSPLPIANGGTATATPGLVAGTNIAIANPWPNQTISFTGLLPIASGGTGTATPALVAGASISITGTWPNNTIANTAPALWTAFTQDLGAAQSSGTFDITGLAGLTVGKYVDIQQTAASIASKGSAQDEGQFDAIEAWGIVLDAATIRAQWRATGVAVGTYAFAYLVSA